MTSGFPFPGLPGVDGGAFQVAPTDVADLRFRLRTNSDDHSRCELGDGPRPSGRYHSLGESDLVVDE